MRPLVVVYDQGAASVGEIGAGLLDVAPLVFVPTGSAHARSMRPLMARFGEVATPETLAGHRPAGIVTYSERGLRPAADLALRLGLPFHDAATTRALTDKWAQRRALAAGGVPVPRVRRVARAGDWADAVAEVGLPAVLKPAHGGGSIDTHLVRDADTGGRIAAALLAGGSPGFEPGGALVLEEYLRGRDTAPFGDYVSVESAVVAGRVEHIAVTGKLPLLPPFRERGNFWPPALSDDEQAEVTALAARAVGACGVTGGLTHTEVKLTPDGPRVIEVNGRLGGDLDELTGFVTGRSLVEVAGRIALGQPVDVPRAPRGRVWFHQRHVWPRVPAELVAIDGVEELRALPGVSSYRPLARPGATAPGGTHTAELDGTLGVVADHATYAALADRISATLRFRVRLDGCERVLTGHELGEL
ncbi:hypothetical protein [Actinosynnema sp. NPDC023587]|uniref:ATP-binding protein n=1 Tax=Actinosynnema sp. NPDC023587 TaxID=3154695 RepID=UPI0033E75D12